MLPPFLGHWYSFDDTARHYSGRAHSINPYCTCGTYDSAECNSVLLLSDWYTVRGNVVGLDQYQLSKASCYVRPKVELGTLDDLFGHPWGRTRVRDKVPGVGAIHREPWKEGIGIDSLTVLIPRSASTSCSPGMRDLRVAPYELTYDAQARIVDSWSAEIVWTTLRCPR